MTRVAAAALSAALAWSMGCAPAAKPTALDRLHPCTSDEGPTDAYCGRYKVFENRETKQGRTIDLRIIVLPALANEPKPDPLFFFAGGPGQGAGDLARPLRDIFRSVQQDRDIVFIDQRGTGKSNLLDCSQEDDEEDDSLAEAAEAEAAALDRLKKCMAGYDADLTQYTTDIAIDDFNEVRGFLGYDKINIYGGSYGTRAGLVYLRRHGDTVRAIVLDGNAPTDMRLPLYFPRDAQRSLDKLIADCEANAGCKAKYPELGSRIVALFTKLELSRPKVTLTHPRTGKVEEMTITPMLVANVIASALYQPLVASLVPELVARAEAGDYQGLLALAYLGEGTGDSKMAIGLQLSVICSEDYTRIQPGDLERESAGSLFARHLLRMQFKACEFWPKGKVDASYFEPVTSDVPALVLSGDLDPVTPPMWGQQVADHLPHSKHVVVSGTGHGVLTTGCGQRMIRDFIKAGTVEGLDTSCNTAVERPPFFLTPAGPDPAAGKAKAATP